MRSILLAVSTLVLVAGESRSQQPIPVDSELQVNTCTTSAQHRATVPSDGSDGLVVACRAGVRAARIPDWPQTAKLIASDGAPADLFGRSVALSGDTALVGAHGDDDNGYSSGSAYVFVRTGEGWREQVRLLAGDGARGDEFGRSVALSGDTALVGAWLDANNNGKGSAYIFVRSGDVWTEQAKLEASDGAPHDFLGVSVALSGDTALVGAPSDEDNGFASGSAYVFVRSGDVWAEQAKLLPTDGQAGDQFGLSVAVSGSTALIGALGDDDKGDAAGSAYVFVRSSGIWTEQAKLLASNGNADDAFGISVALSRAELAADTALVGACERKNGLCSGSAYVFVRSGEAWSEQTELVPADGSDGDSFGSSVALSGGTALVGAFTDTDNGPGSGSAHVFVRSDGVWSEQAELVANDGAAGDHFGISVALSEAGALIGAWADDDNGYASGSAYVFSRHFFADGFESGDTSAWSVTVP